MYKKGILTIISGFSGAGKGSLVKLLLKKYKYSLSISATTRLPREGEINGREYFFLTKKEFEGMIENDDFLEWAEYVENYYGTPKKYVQEQLETGKDIILEIEMQGALQIKKKFPEALLVFITPPTIKELEMRLLERGSETEDTIQKRLMRAKEESIYLNQYDFIIVNDILEEAMEKVHFLVTSQHCKTSWNQQLICQLQEELKVY